MLAWLICCGAFLTVPACAQSDREEPAKVSKKHPKRSPAGDIGSGAASVGAGVASGVGSAAAGTAKGAVDLATLHPVDAAGAVGEGAVKAGTSVAVGSAKGAGKISKGVGRTLKKVL